jgi:hypothetical protein
MRRSIHPVVLRHLVIADVPTVTVTAAYSPHITYIMTQQRDYEMQPLAWRDTSLADVFITQDHAFRDHRAWAFRLSFDASWPITGTSTPRASSAYLTNAG